MKTLLLLLLFSVNLVAHPHIFIEYGLEVVVEKSKISGFYVTMQFDEMFSASIIEGADKDKSGSFSKSETAIVNDEFFSNLKNYNYYLHFHLRFNVLL